MIYDNPYDLIDHVRPDSLRGLSEDAKDVLRCCLDFEAIQLVLLTDCVKTMDTITGDVLGSDTIDEYITYSIEYAMEEA